MLNEYTKYKMILITKLSIIMGDYNYLKHLTRIHMNCELQLKLFFLANDTVLSPESAPRRLPANQIEIVKKYLKFEAINSLLRCKGNAYLH